MDTEDEDGRWGAETLHGAGNIRPRLVSVAWVFLHRFLSQDFCYEPELFPVCDIYVTFVVIASVIPNIIPGLCSQVKLRGRREFWVELWFADPPTSSVN